jgi:hypothetical protein
MRTTVRYCSFLLCKPFITEFTLKPESVVHEFYMSFQLVSPLCVIFTLFTLQHWIVMHYGFVNCQLTVTGKYFLTYSTLKLFIVLGFVGGKQQSMGKVFVTGRTIVVLDFFLNGRRAWHLIGHGTVLFVCLPDVPLQKEFVFEQLFADVTLNVRLKIAVLFQLMYGQHVFVAVGGVTLIARKSKIFVYDQLMVDQTLLVFVGLRTKVTLE